MNTLPSPAIDRRRYRIIRRFFFVGRLFILFSGTLFSTARSFGWFAPIPLPAGKKSAGHIETWLSRWAGCSSNLVNSSPPGSISCHGRLPASLPICVMRCRPPRYPKLLIGLSRILVARCLNCSLTSRPLPLGSASLGAGASRQTG